MSNFESDYFEIFEAFTRWYEEWIDKYEAPQHFVKEYTKDYVVTMTPGGFNVNR